MALLGAPPAAGRCSPPQTAVPGQLSPIPQAADLSVLLLLKICHMQDMPRLRPLKCERCWLVA